jgi:hypothetical protein
MKKVKYIYIVFAIFLGSCAKTEFDGIPFEKIQGEKWETTITIAQLKNNYMTSTGLFTADKIENTTDLVFNGIVTSSDIEGNVYKYLTVQEEEENAQAIKISIDVSGLSAIYPLGQRISVRCNDLYIGKYAESPQIGIRYVNKEKNNRIEPGRMPKLLSDIHISAYGLPEPQAVIADTMTIAEIKAAGSSLFNKLVCIKNAYFTGKGANYGKPAIIPDNDKIFAPPTNGIGYPQSREIQDGTGSIFVSTSEYAKFASKPLPPSSMRGNITAIVGWYNDKDETHDSSKIYHQLTLRTLKDLGKGFESYLAQYNN